MVAFIIVVLFPILFYVSARAVGVWIHWSTHLDMTNLRNDSAERLSFREFLIKFNNTNWDFDNKDFANSYFTRPGWNQLSDQWIGNNYPTINDFVKHEYEDSQIHAGVYKFDGVYYRFGFIDFLLLTLWTTKNEVYPPKKTTSIQIHGFIMKNLYKHLPPLNEWVYFHSCWNNDDGNNKTTQTKLWQKSLIRIHRIDVQDDQFNLYVEMKMLESNFEELKHFVSQREQNDYDRTHPWAFDIVPSRTTKAVWREPTKGEIFAFNLGKEPEPASELNPEQESELDGFFEDMNSINP